MRLLGYEPKRIPPGHPVVGRLYRASLAADKAPDPTEVEAFLKLDTAALEPEARAAEQRRHLGDREKGRQTLLEIVRQEQRRLRDLRDVLYDETDAPALEQAVALARTFDTSPEAALARRYESANALELHRHLADFHRARRDAETRADAAPNERQDGKDRVSNPEPAITSASEPGAPPASRPRPDGVEAVAATLTEGVGTGARTSLEEPRRAPADGVSREEPR